MEGAAGWPGSLAAQYCKNLSALYRAQPDVALQIDGVPFAACPVLETARDGDLTARLTADDGKAVYAHSRHEPRAEARRFVEAQTGPSGEADEQRSEHHSFFVAGSGLGYTLVELERRFDRPCLIVSEDDLGLLKAALCVSDLAEPLAQGRLIFLTALDKARFHAALRPINADVLLGLRYLALPYSTRRHAAFQSESRRLLLDFVAFARLQMVTLVRNARITCKNIAFNLPAYLARPGVEVLQGRACGYPAIVVAAGPSLARNVDQLAGLRDRAVIIAVQTVFKPLLARGLTPHFVTSLDFHELSGQFFQGVADVGDTILVAEPKATWHVLEAFSGRAHVLHNEWYDDALRECAPRRGRLKAGSTVAHLAFYLAEHLGCDPIILVGQDLSFTEGLYYPPGMPIEQVWRPELGRFYTVEMKQWERIVRARSALRVVEDIHGQATYTDEQLFTYAEQFQSDFAASAARVIHACEGGMRLAGVEVMTLREAAEQFCARPLPRDMFRPGSESCPPEWRARARQSLEQRLAELDKLAEIAAEMHELLSRLTALLDRPQEFNRVLVRVDDLRSAVRQHEQTYKMVVGVSQLAELRRYSADRRLGEPEEETVETARRRLARDRDFVSAFRDGCEYLRALLPQTIRRLEEKPA